MQRFRFLGQCPLQSYQHLCRSIFGEPSQIHERVNQMGHCPEILYLWFYLFKVKIVRKMGVKFSWHCPFTILFRADKYLHIIENKHGKV